MRVLSGRAERDKGTASKCRSQQHPQFRDQRCFPRSKVPRVPRVLRASWDVSRFEWEVGQWCKHHRTISSLVCFWQKWTLCSFVNLFLAPPIAMFEWSFSQGPWKRIFDVLLRCWKVGGELQKSFETCNKPCLGSLRLPLTTLSPSVTLDLLSDLLCFVASLLRCLLFLIVPYCSFTIFLHFFCRLCTISPSICPLGFRSDLSVSPPGSEEGLKMCVRGKMAPWLWQNLTFFQHKVRMWYGVGVMVDMWYDMVQ